MGHWPCLVISTQNSRKWRFLCENWSQISAEITKFAPSMYPGILSACIENGDHWTCSLRSLWPLFYKNKSSQSGLSVWDNLLWIWAWITKFAPNTLLGIFSLYKNWDHWPRSPRPFGHFDSKKQCRRTSVFDTDSGWPMGCNVLEITAPCINLNLCKGSDLCMGQLSRGSMCW